MRKLNLETGLVENSFSTIHSTEYLKIIPYIFSHFCFGNCATEFLKCLTAYETGPNTLADYLID